FSRSDQHLRQPACANSGVNSSFSTLFWGLKRGVCGSGVGGLCTELVGESLLVADGESANVVMCKFFAGDGVRRLPADNGGVSQSEDWSSPSPSSSSSSSLRESQSRADIFGLQ